MPDNPSDPLMVAITRLERTTYGDHYDRENTPGLVYDVSVIKRYVQEERAERELLKKALEDEKTARESEGMERQIEEAKRHGVKSVFTALVWFIRFFGVGSLIAAAAWAVQFIQGRSSP